MLHVDGWSPDALSFERSIGIEMDALLSAQEGQLTDEILAKKSSDRSSTH
jgi:hypothetical protein